MNRKNESVSLVLISIALSLAGSGCIRESDEVVMLSTLTPDSEENCSYEVVRKERARRRTASRLARSCAWELERRKHKKRSVFMLAINCEWELERRKHKKWMTRMLARSCAWELERRKHKKWMTRILARSCAWELGRRKHRKWMTRILAEDCRWEVVRKKEKKEQEVALILAKNPTQRPELSRVDQRRREEALSLINRKVPIREVCRTTGFTPDQVESLCVAFQKWEEDLLVAQMKQLSQQEDLIQRFESMDYPIYLLKEDRDQAHDAIMNCYTVAAIRTLGLTGPNLVNAAKSQRVSDLIDYLMKKQRAKVRNNMHKKLLSENFSIGCCIDSLDASSPSHEIDKLKKIYCSLAVPIEVVAHILEYDEELYAPGMSPLYNYSTDDLSVITLRGR